MMKGHVHVVVLEEEFAFLVKHVCRGRGQPLTKVAQRSYDSVVRYESYDSVVRYEVVGET
jgi:hypothetical protein